MIALHKADQSFLDLPSHTVELGASADMAAIMAVYVGFYVIFGRRCPPRSLGSGPGFSTNGTAVQSSCLCVLACSPPPPQSSPAPLLSAQVLRLVRNVTFTFRQAALRLVTRDRKRKEAPTFYDIVYGRA